MALFTELGEPKLCLDKKVLPVISQIVESEAIARSNLN